MLAKLSVMPHIDYSQICGVGLASYHHFSTSGSYVGAVQYPRKGRVVGVSLFFVRVQKKSGALCYSTLVSWLATVESVHTPWLQSLQTSQMRDLACLFLFFLNLMLRNGAELPLRRRVPQARGLFLWNMHGSLQNCPEVTVWTQPSLADKKKWWFGYLLGSCLVSPLPISSVDICFSVALELLIQVVLY